MVRSQLDILQPVMAGHDDGEANRLDVMPGTKKVGCEPTFSVRVGDEWLERIGGSAGRQAMHLIFSKAGRMYNSVARFRSVLGCTRQHR